MGFLMALSLSFLAQGGETSEFNVMVQVKDTSQFDGKVKLPTKLKIKTKYGVVETPTATLIALEHVGDYWTARVRKGTKSSILTGQLVLGTLKVVTEGGTLNIPEADIVAITFRAAPRPPLGGGVPRRGNRPGVNADGSKITPTFKGFEFRKTFPVRHRKPYDADVALLLSNGTHLALLDNEAADLVLLEVATGKATRLKVNTGASHFLERNGKLYVANGRGRNVSVVDAQTLKPLRQIPVPGEAKWLAAPDHASVLYVAVPGSNQAIQCIDVNTDTLTEALDYGREAALLKRIEWLGVTPDNGRLLAFPSVFGPPMAFDLQGLGLSAPERYRESVYPRMKADWAAGRTYFGSHIYSIDLKTRITTLTNADLLTPHPTMSVIFGRRIPTPSRNRRQNSMGTVVDVYDEETFGKITEIEIGARVLALVASEKTLYVVSETHVYPVDIKSQVKADAVARRKPVRNDADLAAIAAARATTKRDRFRLPKLGGWSLLADQRTLVVAIAEKAQLLFIDTVDGTELKRVDLDFKPARMARQKTTLWIIGQNSSILYGVDAGTGKQVKKFQIPSDPLVRVACADRGRIYASNSKAHVLSIDPSRGAASSTPARGLFLAVDPGGKYVYTGFTSRSDWNVEVEKGPDGRTTYYYDNWGYRSMIRKYVVTGASLRRVSYNDNTAVNGRSMVLSPKGDRIAMVGGGGWRAKRGGGAGGYTIAVYQSKDLSTIVGQVNVGAYPENVAFHPALDLGVSLKSDAEFTLFNAKSLAQIKRWKISGAPRGFNEPGWLMFAGRGENLVYWQMGGHNESDGKLYLISLDLTAEQKATLVKVYGESVTVENPAKLFSSAEKAERTGDKSAAIRLYRRVAEADPGSALGKRASKKVLELSTSAGSSAPSSGAKRKGPATSLLKTAQALEKVGQTAGALRYYKRLVGEHPTSPEAAEARKKIKELEKK